VQVFFVAYLIAIGLFTVREGYVETRHLLPLVVATAGCTAWGVLQTSAGLSRLFKGEAGHARWALPAVIGLLAVAMGPRTFDSIHASRLGHRLAGDWLAERAATADRFSASRDAGPVVIDTRGWTGLRSGWATHTFDHAAEMLAAGRVRYLVIERDERQWDSPRGRTLRHLLAVAARRDVAFPAQGADREAVEIYHWDADAFAPHTGVESAGKATVVHATLSTTDR
jgi:hypothetical protein